MKEIDLFLFLLDNKYPDLQKSEGIYDSFDCISRDSNAYIELKCRNTHYPTLLAAGEATNWRTALGEALSKISLSSDKPEKTVNDVAKEQAEEKGDE